MQAQTPGSVDPTFDVGEGPNGAVRSVLALPDGTTLVGGDFDFWNGTYVNSLVRLRTDGSRDDSFSAPSVPDFDAYGLWRQPDGKILVSGYFDLPGGQHYLARLQANGALDETFKADFDNLINDVLILADGRLVVLGWFQKLGGLAAQGIVRLQANGALDPTFQPPRESLSGFGYSAVRLKNGDYLVAGLNFRQDNQSLYGLLRIHPDGTIDRGYSLDSLNNDGIFANKLQIGPDGSIMLSSVFRVSRLTPEGFIDPAFNSVVFDDSAPEVLLVQPDGRLLAGDFNAGTVGGAPRCLVQADADGQLNASFLTQFTASVGTAGVRYGGVINTDYAVVAGNFDRVDGQVRNSVARVLLRDRKAPAQVQWNAQYMAALESAGTVTLTVLRDGDVSKPANVSYRTLSSSSSEEVDFTPAQGVLRFGTNETFRRLEVAIHDNAEAFGNRWFRVQLFNALGAEIGSNSIIEVTLLDDDSTIQLATTNATIPEINTSVRLQAGRKGGMAVPAAMRWRVAGGTARPGIDFTPTNGVVVFGPGNTSGSINFTLFDNAVADGTRTIEVELVPGEFAAALGSTSKATINLLDNDLPGFGGDGFDGTISGFLPLTDGNSLVYGSFKRVHGLDYAGVTTLRPDGRVNPSPAMALSELSGVTRVTAAAATREGKLLLAGAFSAINGVGTGRIARVDADGNVDPSFILTGFTRYEPRALAQLTDGSILAAGLEADFTIQAGMPFNSPGGAIIKFSAEGTRDLAFETRTAASVSPTLIPLEGGGFLAGGVRVYRDRLQPFGSASPPSLNNPVLRRDVARFLANGELDLGFEVKLDAGNNPFNRSPTLSALWIETDGRLVVAGAFTNVNGRFQPGLARLLPTGALDETFDATKGLGSKPVQVLSAIRLPQGDILVAFVAPGLFPNSSSSPILRRLNPDGSRRPDMPDHQVETMSTPGLSLERPPLGALRNGQVFVGFSGFQFDSLPRYRFAWLEADGTLGSDQPLTIRRWAATPGGDATMLLRTRAEGRFQIERSPDLLNWTTDGEFSPDPSGVREVALPAGMPASYLRATLVSE